jgi:hypothetical protein
MAKGQMRQTKEKKKQKATDKPKQVSAYKSAMQSGSSGASIGVPKK